VTPAKASVSRMLDFEMPNRERSARILKASGLDQAKVIHRPRLLSDNVLSGEPVSVGAQIPREKNREFRETAGISIFLSWKATKFQ
jgi:hypothetical protein